MITATLYLFIYESQNMETAKWTSVDESTMEWMNIATMKYIHSRAEKLSKAEPYAKQNKTKQIIKTQYWAKEVICKRVKMCDSVYPVTSQDKKK